MTSCNEEYSWEDIYDSGQLDQQLENFDSDKLQPIELTGEHGDTEEGCLKSGSDKTQIRILKRSESSKGGEVETCHPENRHLIEKSVAQREKDYALARERIMGTKQGKSQEKKRDRPRRNNHNNSQSKQPG